MQKKNRNKTDFDTLLYRSQGTSEAVVGNYEKSSSPTASADTSGAIHPLRAVQCSTESPSNHIKPQSLIIQVPKIWYTIYSSIALIMK